jgi:hypothetical protein
VGRKAAREIPFFSVSSVSPWFRFFLVMAGPTGPAFGRPEDKLRVPAIHEGVYDFKWKNSWVAGPTPGSQSGGMTKKLDDKAGRIHATAAARAASFR